VALNPRDSAAWIDLGLEAEARGDLPRAEKALLEAARVDLTFQPRWTLANYYFRRELRESFWHWARQAAAMSYGDVSALFCLCWRTTADPEWISEHVAGDRANLLRQFLDYLISEHHLEAAEAVAHRLIRVGGPDAAVPLLAYCDRLLEAGRFEPAVRTWNALASRGLIGLSPLEPEAGRVLTNGEFSAPPRGRGFDWRFHRVEGVSITHTSEPAGVRLAFSGRQPEDCELATQFLPLRPGSAYRLSYRYRTAGAPEPSGLEWHISGARSAPLSSEDWRAATLDFVAAAGAVPRLALRYRRAAGTTRIEGALWISQVRLEPRPAR
jgi:tetratricopeptide (TPR) repeat protein